VVRPCADTACAIRRAERACRAVDERGTEEEHCRAEAADHEYFSQPERADEVGSIAQST